MRIGFIGLGKMGLNMALNVMDKQWEVIGFDASSQARERADAATVQTVSTIEALLDSLDEQKIIFLSTPAGRITNSLVEDLLKALDKGDVIIDSGNSNFNDSLKNYQAAKEQGIHFVDCGTSGGMEGARNGACLMVGGDEEAVKIVEPFLKDLACEDGYLYSGKAGSGHYLKMVHNGIEYAMMQAIGEGFQLLEASDYSFDLEKVANVWNHGSVIEAKLMELAEQSFAQDPHLDEIKGEVDASGEAKWTIEEALSLDIPVPTIALSLFVRNQSKISDSFSNKVVASLRHGFGGHAVVKSN
ncbi:phosphogluconate dehydrogenase (NAD(+)-dependent, decarboxylating) [Enterococcus pallens]|uniref:6-phosphogluconate dehydrogenase (Decarboxylating) n=1 Tax=Enterococcus pallens ATCC BAA-351 TaxID=1158607 RepID=R2SR66_9ENTE|nr:decarboxylating 6-phosphogluconate dehydrogenase [Enterococcus pallens]EOH97750.1 6-phosphogluconate dehydrogenase (decarboxylating) [Enterococcus pallens ATCC BAA-351]EOU20831.1 6-phosphogluconate dehydrogenase (decarboxylating) [Enterococcus pallens ATCC BAA-351]